MPTLIRNTTPSFEPSIYRVRVLVRVRVRGGVRLRVRVRDGVTFFISICLAYLACSASAFALSVTTPFCLSLGMGGEVLDGTKWEWMWVQEYLNFFLVSYSSTVCSAAARFRPTCNSMTSFLFASNWY